MKTLSDVPVGWSVRMAQLRSRPEMCARLRDLGSCESTVVRCVTKGSGNLICEVCNTRIGLNLLTANSIFVSPIE